MEKDIILLSGNTAMRLASIRSLPAAGDQGDVRRLRDGGSVSDPPVDHRPALAAAGRSL
jgi:hypothetical protein